MNSQSFDDLDHKCVADDPLFEWKPPRPSINDVGLLATFLESLDAEMPYDLAFRLLREFGSMSRLLSSSRWRLRRNMPKKLAQAFKASTAMMESALAEVVAERPLLMGTNSLLHYLQFSMGFLDHERLVAIYVDHDTRLLKIVELEEGSAGGLQINQQPILREGLAIGAGGFILVHNHPSGDPHPSKADKVFTMRLMSISDELDMPLIDHLIIAKEKTYSFRMGKLIDGPEPWTGGDIPGESYDEVKQPVTSESVETVETHEHH